MWGTMTVQKASKCKQFQTRENQFSSLLLAILNQNSSNKFIFLAFRCPFLAVVKKHQGTTSKEVEDIEEELEHF